MSAQRGFILVEFLVATVLFSIAGSGLYTGFMTGLRAHQRIRQSFAAYDPLRILFLRLEGDLRNAVVLKEYPFKGKAREIQFPAALHHKLLLIQYSVKDHSLIRTEEELTAKLSKDKPKEKTLMEGTASLEFRFPYEDEEEKRTFESFWLEEPYYGIPRAVELGIEKDKRVFTKLISIPQGRIGRIEHDAR